MTKIIDEEGGSYLEITPNESIPGLFDIKHIEGVKITIDKIQARQIIKALQDILISDYFLNRARTKLDKVE